MILSGLTSVSFLQPNLYEVVMFRFSSPRLALIVLMFCSSAFSVPLSSLCSVKLKMVRFNSHNFSTFQFLVSFINY